MIIWIRCLLFLAFTCSIYSNSYGQDPLRYQQEIFSSTKNTDNVEFSSSVPQPINAFDIQSFLTGLPLNVKEYNTQAVNLYMDIYQPLDDTIQKRPLIILCFGGGFLRGTRDHWSIKLLAQGLARLGYVTASIDYRLGMNIYDKDMGARSVYRAIQDSRSAVRYFKADATTNNLYKIDTSHIFIGGHSSGGFVALHNLYMDRDEERPVSTRTSSQDGQIIPDLGCLDCVGNNLSFSGKATGAFNLAGALGFLNYIEHSSEPPPIMFHSQDDSTVPFEDGKPFNDVSILITGEDLPVVYGSSAISKRCDTLGLENQFHSYEGEEARGHDVHENGTVALHMDIIPSISNWFYEKYLRPQNLSITGIENICSEDVNQTYEIPSEGFVYYDWEITGGQLINVDPLSNSIAVIWDNAIGSKELSVRPYLCNAVPGEKVSIPVELHVPSSNEWLGGNGMWSTVSNWGNGHIPLSCEDVILPAESSLVEVVVAPLSVGKIRSLRIGYNVKLLVPASANITIE